MRVPMRHFRNLAAIWLVVVVGVFAASALVERLGLVGGYALHIVRGLAASLLAVVAAAAYLLRHVILLLHDERDRLAHAKAELQGERESLQAIVDCMADAVVFVTPDGVVRLRNRAATKLWPEGFAMKGDLFACHRPEKWDELRRRVSEPEGPELHPLLEAGGRTFEASYAPVRTRQGQLDGVVMVARDVTERIETQRWRMQEERMAVVGRLAAGLAHELNNPLASIALFARHALDRLEPGHALADHLGTVLRNADLCKKIVRDLLEYARQRPPSLRPVALEELLGNVVRTIEPQANAARVALVSEPVPAGTPAVFGDADQLRQVLVNLGLNAIEAMPEGGRLVLRAGPGDDGKVRVDVEDTGPGIPLEEQERIFSAFHTTKPEGTGLGLTVVRDLVTLHGGKVSVRSAPGQGSTFGLELPAVGDK